MRQQRREQEHTWSKGDDAACWCGQDVTVGKAAGTPWHKAHLGLVRHLRADHLIEPLHLWETAQVDNPV